MTEKLVTSRRFGGSIRRRARSLQEIADEIIDTYDTMGVGAAEWVDAMSCMECVTDRYHDLNGREVVRNFLNCSRGWRTNEGDRIREELRDMVARA